MAVAQTGTTIQLKIKSPANFISFLRRFTGIDKGLLLELHPDCIKAKSHTEDRSVVKYSKMPLVDVLDGTVPVDLIKICIFDTKKVIKIFDHFNTTDEIFLHVKYEHVSGEYVASELLFKGPALKIKVLTVDTAVFNFISPEMLKKVLESVTSDKLIEFPFPKDAFSRVSSLCSIDTAKDFLTIKVENNEINVKGKSFEYTVGSITSSETVNFTFYNEHFGLVESEVSMFIVGNNRMLIKSQESDTMIIIGRIE